MIGATAILRACTERLAGQRERADVALDVAPDQAEQRVERPFVRAVLVGPALERVEHDFVVARAREHAQRRELEHGHEIT